MDPPQETMYIGNSMVCTRKVMELVAQVVGLDIIELWTEDSNSTVHCTYVYATEDMKLKNPGIITGHYPQHKRDHILSPKLCEYAKMSETSHYWSVKGVDADSIEADVLNINIQTEVSYCFEADGIRVFIVGFVLEKVPFKEKLKKFISGISYSIYVAAFDLDDEGDDNNDIPGELSGKQPRSIPRNAEDGPSCEEAEIGALKLDAATGAASAQGAGQSYREDTHSSMPKKPGHVENIFLEDVPTVTKYQSDDPAGSIAASSVIADESDHAHHEVLSHSRSSHTYSLVSSNQTYENQYMYQETALHPAMKNRVNSPPEWDPVDIFSFPIGEIPVKRAVPGNLVMEHFTDIQYIADGSNANIFLARLNGEKVVIKMIKEGVECEPVAVHEFNVEYGVLVRLDHPNIIKLIGAGVEPRQFIVLEWLGGGTLSSILQQNQVKPGLAQRLFRRPSFTYANLLSRAKDIVDALHFLNTQAHEGATIIHRDLKPDNIGFTADGKLKLFDFGLCTCVKAHAEADDTYEMTGNTGSLRYMAPEVALKRAYNEKADVHSFGVLLWQMARDRVPYKGMTREEFMQTVVDRHERPKLDKSWPKPFSDMILDCWNPDYKKRPSFGSLSKTLQKLQNSATSTNSSVQKGAPGYSSTP